MLIAKARVTLQTADFVIERMCDHFSEGGAFVTQGPTGQIVTFDFGSGSFEVGENIVEIVAEADDAVEMYNLRWMLAEHLVEYAAPQVLEIAWTGDGSDLATPPYFRLIEVVGAENITPHMRRLTFKGKDLERFATDEDFHIKLYLPRAPGVVPEWPSVGADGIPRHPSGEAAAIARRYTIRQIDSIAQTFDVDFVVHESAGPGSGFAENAEIGDIVGMTGPGGGAAPLDRDWYLFAGDETALPAIARILELLPATASGTALIEIEDGSEMQVLTTKADIEVEWRIRGRETASLADAVRAVDLPQHSQSIFVWAACEFTDFRAIRSYVRNDCRLRKDQHLIVSYWRRGHTETAGSN